MNLHTAWTAWGNVLTCAKNKLTVNKWGSLLNFLHKNMTIIVQTCQREYFLKNSPHLPTKTSFHRRKIPLILIKLLNYTLNMERQFLTAWCKKIKMKKWTIDVEILYANILIASNNRFEFPCEKNEEVGLSVSKASASSQMVTHLK